MMRPTIVQRGTAWIALAAMALAAVLAPGCQPTGGDKPAKEPPAAPVGQTPDAAAPADAPGQSLFDGKTLANWKVTEFGGEGKVHVQDGQMLLELGAGPLTGVTWAGGALPTMDYEVTLEAMRVEGSDFFCGLTFPVRQSACSLICGGWGGNLVGISSFDDMDAANNETTTFYEFENKRWYPIRVRVTEKRIEAWIDGQKKVDAEPGNRKIDVRFEVEPSKPCGIAAYMTKAAIRNIRVRTLEDGEVQP